MAVVSWSLDSGGPAAGSGRLVRVAVCMAVVAVDDIRATGGWWRGSVVHGRCVVVVGFRGAGCWQRAAGAGSGCAWPWQRSLLWRGDCSGWVQVDWLVPGVIAAGRAMTPRGACRQDVCTTIPCPPRSTEPPTTSACVAVDRFLLRVIYPIWLYCQPFREPGVGCRASVAAKTMANPHPPRPPVASSRPPGTHRPQQRPCTSRSRLRRQQPAPRNLPAATTAMHNPSQPGAGRRRAPVPGWVVLGHRCDHWIPGGRLLAAGGRGGSGMCVALAAIVTLAW